MKVGLLEYTLWYISFFKRRVRGGISRGIGIICVQVFPAVSRAKNEVYPLQVLTFLMNCLPIHGENEIMRLFKRRYSEEAMKRRNRCVCLSPFLMLMVMILLFAGQVWASAPVSNPRCTAVSKPGDGAAKMAVRNAWGTLPLSFIRNDGQLDKRVKFYEKGSGHATYFTGDGIYILLVGEKRGSSSSLTGEDGPSSAGMNRRTSFIKLAPIDANTTQHITAEGLQSGKINYFMTRNPEKWKTDIPTYRTVVYREVYAGVDMKFYGNNSLLEYDIIVKPGAEPKTIRLAYEGIHGLSVTKEGDLAITLDGGTIIQKKPSVYQEFDGIKREIAGRFRVFDDVPVDKASGSTGAARRFVYGFEVASYDTTHPLIIDPVLVFSTYLGGSALDSAYDIAVDGSGNIYVTGSTFSSDFPTASAMYTKNTPGVSNSDAFVTKLSSSGSALVYSTYLGGSSDDSANGIAVDSLRNVYIRNPQPVIPPRSPRDPPSMIRTREGLPMPLLQKSARQAVRLIIPPSSGEAWKITVSRLPWTVREMPTWLERRNPRIFRKRMLRMLTKEGLPMFLLPESVPTERLMSIPGISGEPTMIIWTMAGAPSP